jgi:hypothetical protein
MANNLLDANQALKSIRNARSAQNVSKKSKSGRIDQFKNCVQKIRGNIPFDEQLNSIFNYERFIKEEDEIENLEVAILINKILIQSEFFNFTLIKDFFIQK